MRGGVRRPRYGHSRFLQQARARFVVNFDTWRQRHAGLLLQLFFAREGVLIVLEHGVTIVSQTRQLSTNRRNRAGISTAHAPDSLRQHGHGPGVVVLKDKTEGGLGIFGVQYEGMRARRQRRVRDANALKPDD